MNWLWILGILIFLLLLLFGTRLGVRAAFGGDVLILDVKVGLFHFRVMPRREKTPDPKKEARKAAEAAAKEKARRAAKEAKKDDGKGLSVKTEKLKAVLSDVEDAVHTLWPPLKRALNRTRRGIRIHPLQLSLTVGGSDDPAAGAELYGYLHAGIWSVMPLLEQLLVIPDPYLHVGIDFDSPDTRAEGELGASIRIGTLLAVGFTVAVPALRWFLKWNKKKKQRQQESEKVQAAKKMRHKKG